MVCTSDLYSHTLHGVTQRQTQLTGFAVAEETVAYEPVFFWQKIRRGADLILAHVLSGWRQLTERMVLNG